jgi:hypothetical protein
VVSADTDILNEPLTLDGFEVITSFDMHAEGQNQPNDIAMQ